MVIRLISHDLVFCTTSAQIVLAQNLQVPKLIQGSTDCRWLHSLPVLIDLLEDTLSTGMAFQLTGGLQNGESLAG